jgi:hypothetical protein
MSKYRRFYCCHCETERPFRRPRVDHRFHLLVSAFTLGLWLPIWLGIILKCHRADWCCRNCGHRHEPKIVSLRKEASAGLRYRLKPRVVEPVRKQSQLLSLRTAKLHVTISLQAKELGTTPPMESIEIGPIDWPIVAHRDRNAA